MIKDDDLNKEFQKRGMEYGYNLHNSGNQKNKKTNSQNKSYINENHDKTINDLLYKKVKGFIFVRYIPKNTKLILENIVTGSIKIKNPGLRLNIPFIQKATVMRMSSFSLQYNFKENDGTVTNDGVDVHGVSIVEYKVAAEQIEKFYIEEYADEQITNRTQSIISKFVNLCNWEEIKSKPIIRIEYTEDDKNKDIIFTNITGIAPGVPIELEEEIIYLKQQYGIEISTISLTKFQAPKTISEMEEEKRKKEHDIDMKKLEAQAQLDVSEIEAKSRINIGRAEAIIKKMEGIATNEAVDDIVIKLKKEGFSNDAIKEYLVRKATPSGSVVIENNGMNSGITAATLTQQTGFGEKRKGHNK